MTDCLHLTLKRSLSGMTVFYKCADCGKNFVVPKPLVIKVTYPKQ